jgi:predicted transcriptional regulator
MVTTQDFQSFADFALPLISSGKADSIAQLVQQWEVEREQLETLQSIERGIADVEAGRVTPANEVFAQVRQELGLNQ